MPAKKAYGRNPENQRYAEIRVLNTFQIRSFWFIFEKKSRESKKKNKPGLAAFILLLTISSLSLQAHPFYVSICDINYNTQNQSLEISIRLFTTDIEKTMDDWGAEKLYLGEQNESPKADSVLAAYLPTVLEIKTDEKATPPFQYLGKEVEGEMCWIYIEVPNIPAFEQASVSNRILFQSFPTQTNLIHFNNKGEIKNLLLTKNSPSGVLRWE